MNGIRILVAVCVIAHLQASPPLPTPLAAAPLPAVYTEAQAKRGATVYLHACSGCHLYDLSGGRDPDGLGDAPPLSGETFLRSWNRETIAAFLSVVRTTMPRHKPGELKPDEYLDVVAYVLSVNRFPSGDTELGRDPAVLQRLFAEVADRQGR